MYAIFTDLVNIANNIEIYELGIYCVCNIH